MNFRVGIVAVLCFFLCFSCFSSQCLSGDSLAEAVGAVGESDLTWESVLKRSQRYAKNMVPSASEDIAQDAVMRLLKRKEKLSTLGAKERSSYIWQAVKSSAVDYLKKDGTRLASEKAHVLSRAVPPSSLAQTAISMDLSHQLNKVDVQTKRMWEMWTEGKSTREIGKILRMNKGTVMSRLRRFAKGSGIVGGLGLLLPILVDRFYEAEPLVPSSGLTFRVQLSD